MSIIIRVLKKCKGLKWKLENMFKANYKDGRTM